MPCYGNAYCYLCNVILVTSRKRNEPGYLWLNECIVYDKINDKCYEARAGEDLMNRVYIELPKEEKEYYYTDKETHKQIKYEPTDIDNGKYVASNDEYFLLHKFCFQVYKKYYDKYEEIINPMKDLPDVDKQNGFRSHLEDHKDILYVYNDPRTNLINKNRFIAHIEENKKNVNISLK